MKKAIVLANFGTTYIEAAEASIGVIESRARKEFQDCIVKRAYTSSIVLKRLKKNGIEIPNVDEAIESLRDFDRIIVQPTHIIAGFEYEKIIKSCSKYKNVVIGRPLLYNSTDYDCVAEFINNTFSHYIGSVVIMGHGSGHDADKGYGILRSKLADNIFIATVEGSITLNDIIPYIKDKNILLTPFMIVCGDHGNNDMAVNWKMELEERGFNCELLLKGMGEYKFIQDIFIERIRRML